MFCSGCWQSNFFVVRCGGWTISMEWTDVLKESRGLGILEKYRYRGIWSRAA